MSDVEIHELGAAYALDALDASERAAYEAHFTTCAICRGQVAEHRETAAALAMLTTSAPAPDLRARVLAEVAHTRQLAPRAAPVVTLAERRRPGWTTMLAAAAAVALIAVGAVLVAGRGDASFNEQVAAMMDDPASRMAELDGPAGAFKVVWDDAHVAVLGDALPEPEGGLRYELWMIDAAGAHPMGLLDEAADGGVRRMLDVPPDMAADGWGVTLEPASGSSTPTLPILYQADV